MIGGGDHWPMPAVPQQAAAKAARVISGLGHKPTARLKSFLRQLRRDLTGAFNEALDNRT
jgi:hypothetical protein